MKRIFLLVLLFLVIIPAQAAYVEHMPIVRIQPNGDTLRCFVTGDEFYHRMHDAQDYTIVLDTATGYYVYAVALDGMLYPTPFVAGRDNPAQYALLKPGATLGASAIRQLHDRWKTPPQPDLKGFAPSQMKTSGENHGTLNNLVIFIRFADDDEIATPLSSINAMFNDTTGVSMYTYYRAASYGKIWIPSHFYPTPVGDSVRSYQDIYPRSYYMPYSEDNPNGYTEDQHAQREFDMLERAINYVNANSPIPASVDLDMNDDGYVDNVVFVVKGTYTGWADLLWPHKWSLSDRAVYINGKRVYTFNLQLEGSGDHYFSTSTFCHEMSHTLGNPDIYHYDYYKSVHPAGTWDLMEYNQTPPQHTNALFKMIYSNWIDSIPTITAPGTYTLHSIASPTNNAYAIQSHNPHEYFILEYRNVDEPFSEALPGTGLIIYRYNAMEGYSSNMYFDNGLTHNHQYWLFRPYSDNDTTDGNYSMAYFNATSGRNAFNITTNPRPYLCDGSLDTTFNIYNITDGDSTISFTVDFHSPRCFTPLQLRTLSTDTTHANVTWIGSADSFEVVYAYIDTLSHEYISDTMVATTPNATLSDLQVYTQYYWAVRSLCEGVPGEWSEVSSFTTRPHPFRRLYVTPDGNGDGLTWATAMGDINQAITQATLGITPEGTMPQVWVKQGTYTSNRMGTAFYIRQGVSVYGGLDGTEGDEFNPDSTFNGHYSLLDGQSMRPLLEQDMNFNYDSLTIWQGFEIANGLGTVAGGGVRLRENGVLRHCIIHDCHLLPGNTIMGGGIWMSGGTLYDCEVYNNGGNDINGGGVFAATGRLERCNLHHNTGSWGGGLIGGNAGSVIANNCSFTHNTAHNEGGGAYIYNGTFTNCLFADNYASENAGGLYADGRTSSGYNGGTYNNCTFAGNVAEQHAGGIYLETFGGTYRNCIVWGNTSNTDSDQWYANANGGHFHYSAVQGQRNGQEMMELQSQNSGTDTTKNYVRFADPQHGDYRLAPGSACIDAGINSYNSQSLDLDGNPRIQGARIDFGCYEFDPASDTSHVAILSPVLTSISVYPNPASQHLVVQSAQNLNGTTATLYDAVGRIVLRTQLQGNRTQLSLASLPQGIYTLRIDTPQQPRILKIVKSE